MKHRHGLAARGDVGWRILDASGKPTAARGTEKGVPVWGFTAPYANGEDFVVLY